MKRSLFLYLLIIALLMNVFTYAYFTKKSESDQQRFTESTKRTKDSLLLIGNQLDDASYFTLKKNVNAMEYLEDYNIDELVPQITNKIIAYNDAPEGNILVPYDKINGQKFIINKVAVLNHRWIIADFSDGILWGEVLLKYFVEEDGTFTFERIDSVLYQKAKVGS